jgi:hypothetical protein
LAEENICVPLITGLLSRCRCDTFPRGTRDLMDRREKLLPREGNHELLEEQRRAKSWRERGCLSMADPRFVVDLAGRRPRLFA